MRILALETSCDETSAAVVVDGRQVLSNIISSQADFHAQYGGVIPEMAARQHLETINFAIEAALHQANVSLEDIDAFAATLGPGLVGALLVGANAAKTLSFITEKPFIGVNHLHAHVASNYLESHLAPPFVCLLVSGGHTQILHIEAYNKTTLIGQTQDDAIGEAYDKVARLLSLPYPGGPALDKLAQTGDPTVIALPEPKPKNPDDMSYSGLKTAVMHVIEKYGDACHTDLVFRRNLAAAFQERATQMLITKTMRIAQRLGVTTVAAAGGVAANSALRQKLHAAIHQQPGWQLFIPQSIYCTDNAAMVGAAAFLNPLTSDWAIEVFSRGNQPQLAYTDSI